MVKRKYKKRQNREPKTGEKSVKKCPKALSGVISFKKKIKICKKKFQISDSKYYQSKREHLANLAFDCNGSSKVVCTECKCDITRFPKVIIPTKQIKDDSEKDQIVTIEKSNPVQGLIKQEKQTNKFSIICLNCLVSKINTKKLVRQALKKHSKDMRKTRKAKVDASAEETYKENYSFYIVDKMKFPIFTEDWSLEQELKLLTSLEKLGLDNWDSIANQIPKKGKVECESHYYSFYYKNTEEFLPTSTEIILKPPHASLPKYINPEEYIKEPEIDKKLAIANKKTENLYKEEAMKNQGQVPEYTVNSKGSHILNRARSVKKRNQKKHEQNSKTNVSEILGFWPKREEFDIEYLNDAELELSELEFKDTDTKEEYEKKMKILEIYNRELDERQKRKKFVIERSLYDLKKQYSIEKKLNREDKEIYNLLKPFARFFPQEQLTELFEGYVLEKNLKLRYNMLTFYRNQGLKSYEEIQKFIDSEEKKNNNGSNIRKKTLPSNNSINYTGNNQVLSV